MKVRIAQEARLDLQMIGDWIAEQNPTRAISFVAEFHERCATLGQHPRRFPVVRRLDGLDVRKLTHRHYLILYVVLDDAVEVTHVVHGSRDLNAVLGIPPPRTADDT